EQAPWRRQVLFQQRGGIVGIIPEQILGASSPLGLAMAALIQSKNLPAIQKRLKQFAVILPAAGHAMQEEQRDTAGRAHHPMQGQGKEGGEAPGERPPRKPITGNGSPNHKPSKTDKDGTHRSR